MKGNLNLIGTPLTHGYRFCDLFFVTRTAFVMYDTACMYFKTQLQGLNKGMHIYQHQKEQCWQVVVYVESILPHH